MAYNELSKKYGDIRNMMRRFYVYGFETRQDFNDKSQRSYDDERRRIQSWLDEYMDTNPDVAGTAYKISLDSRDISHNPLYKSWKAKSFTDIDITLHFYLLDILADGQAYSVAEMENLLSDRCFNCFSNKMHQPDAKTVRNKLNDYVELGLLQIVKQGRRNLYRLQQDKVNWHSWQLACAFFSEMAPLGEVGSYILDKFPEDCDVFNFKHHFILYTMDSQLLYELLEAINDKKSVILYNWENGQQTVCPLKIYCSTRTGRQYLLGYSYDENKLLFNRLNRIKYIKVKDRENNYEHYLQLAQKAAPHIWGVSLFGAGELERISFTVEVASDEQFIVQRLEREKRSGTVQQLDAAHYRFSIAVYDARELLPWIRTFIGRITAFSCSNKAVQELFFDDLDQMASYYREAEADEKQ